MKKIAMMCMLVVLGGHFAQGQDTLFWYTLAADLTGPDGVVLPGAADDPNVGPMVQLIRASSISAPEWNFGLPYADTDGASGGNVVIGTSYVGVGGSGDGATQGLDLFSAYGVGASSSVYIRVWDRPTSGGGDLPSPQTYSDLGLLALYPTAGVIQGAFYFDAPLTMLSSLPNSGGLYEYVIPVVDQGDWTFLPVPEPGTLALAGLGVLMLAFRRLRRTFAR